MRTANLEKCLSIYKKNGRSKYITLPDMRNFLKTELDLKVTTKMKKPEVTEMFLSNLSVATYPKYNKLERFGLIRMDVQEALNISCAKSRNVVKAFEEKDSVRAQSSVGTNIYIDIYDMEDVLKAMDSVQEGA